jgi:uncharacterized protein (DUF1800 family)
MADWHEDEPVDDPVPAVARTRVQRIQSRAQRAALGWLRTGRPAVHRMLRDRRQVLMALGTGAVALGGLGSTAATLLSDARAANAGGGRRGDGSPRDAGAFSDRDASYVHGVGDLNDLGAGGLADTPSQAAAAALRATPKQATPLSRDPVLHLLRRATFGPTAGDVATVQKVGLDAWIEQQLNPSSVADPVGDQVLAVFPTVAMSITELRAREDDNADPMYELGHSTIGRQIWSSRQLFEVVVDFWNNHLNVTNPFDGGQDSRGPYDRDVVRAHAFGRFEDMLLASARHPAMMRYLDNADSDRRNVNENYGRELLELHSVGIDGGYTEKDVRNSAYIMTGRTVDRNGAFVYQPKRHWTGAVKVLDFAHDNKNASEGLALGDAYVRYLARHPSTANNIARKLAVRFVCDNPPKPLVERLAKTYLQNETAILPMLRVLFRSLEFWIATGLKTRRPLENLVATSRVLEVAPGAKTADALEDMYRLARNLGNAPLAWAAPNGYPDVAAAWTSANGMLATWNAHRSILQGRHRGLTYRKPEQLMGGVPPTVGAFVDTLAGRLVFQPLTAAERQALLKFLGTAEGTKPRDATLGGKLGALAPLVLDSIYHALR